MARPWWQDEVLYQIYPRSFADSNGDGVGDLPGIVDRLDYLEWLGVGAIWLNPIHPSPNVDWGYDVSDYLGVHPELGTIKAEQPPRVILTSNRTREVHDALKRRCLYHWIDYPSAQREFEIVLARVPGAPESLAREVVAFVQRLRQADLTKVPGVAETLDWAAALMSLGARELTPEVVDETLGVVLKYEEDVRHVRGATTRQLLAEAAQRG